MSHGNEPLKLRIYLFFSFPFSFYAFGMGCRSQAACLGTSGGRDDCPHGGPACELDFISGNAATIIMVLLFNQQYLGGGWVS